PALGAAGDRLRGEERLLALDDVQPLDAERVARSEDRAAVVRVVRRVHEDGDRVEPCGDLLAQASATRLAGELLQAAGDRGAVEPGEGADQAAVLLRDVGAVR